MGEQQVRGSDGGPGVDPVWHATGPGAWPYGGPPGSGAVPPAGPSSGPGTGAAAGTRRRRRRRTVLAVVGSATVLAVAAGAVALWPSAGSGPAAAGSTASTGQSPPSGAADSDPKQYDTERAAVASVFAARAAALRTGDGVAWAATVDPAQPALRKSEATLFANLRQLPLASYSWAYDPSFQLSGYPLPDSVTSTLGHPDVAYSPGMTITYQLRGFDQQPVADPYVPVMVRRGGHWYVAGDRTSSATFGEAFDEPWTVGPVKVRRTSRSLVIVSARDAAQLPALARQADAAVAAVAAVWPSGWNHKVVLFATREADVFASYLGRNRAVSEASALTLGVGPARHAPPKDDTRVVLNPQYSRPGGRSIPALLRHEFTHVAQWNSQHAGTPRWAIEGIAEYTAYRHHLSEQRVSGQIVRDAKAHRMPRTLPASSSFYGPDPGESYHYGMAWLAWEYMAETYGEGRVKLMYARLSAIDTPPDGSVALKAEAAAFTAVLHISEPKFVKNLDAWAAKVLRIA